MLEELLEMGPTLHLTPVNLLESCSQPATWAQKIVQKTLDPELLN